MHRMLRNLIIGILNDHLPLLALAIRQRSKFERWLQFELASCIEASGGKHVKVEHPYSGDGSRIDISFDYGSLKYNLELKTVNTNWQISGIEPKGRPITKNLASVVADAQRLRYSKNKGMIAFVIFPIPRGDQRWKNYIKRIEGDIGRDIPVDNYCEIYKIDIADGLICDIVICCFPISESNSE